MTPPGSALTAPLPTPAPAPSVCPRPAIRGHPQSGAGRGQHGGGLLLQGTGPPPAPAPPAFRPLTPWTPSGSEGPCTEEAGRGASLWACSSRSVPAPLGVMLVLASNLKGARLSAAEGQGNENFQEAPWPGRCLLQGSSRLELRGLPRRAGPAAEESPATGPAGQPGSSPLHVAYPSQSVLPLRRAGQSGREETHC